MKIRIINEFFLSYVCYHSSVGLFDRPVSPLINVVENTNNFQVTCELPGIDLKDIDLSIASNVLTIKGEKKEKEEAKGKYYRRESRYGSFQRTLSLPGTVDIK